MHGPTCVFRANLTAFSLKGMYILYDKMPWPTDEEFAAQGATDRGFRGLT